MKRRKLITVAALAVLALGGCKSKPEAVNEPAASVAGVTDDDLCASYCKAEYPNGRCVFGILPMSYDECLKGCKGLITVDTCAELERPLVACQVRKNDCGGCPTEFRAVDDCGQHCAELQIRGATLPEHCSNRRPE